MNTFANPFIASNPFGFTNAFASPASFGSCGTGGFPGVNGLNSAPFFGAPMFQAPWTSPVGQWINTTPTTASYGYANAPTAWTNTPGARFNGFVPTATNSFLNPVAFNGATASPFASWFNGFAPTNAWAPSFNAWNTPFAWNTPNTFGGAFNTPSFQAPTFANTFGPIAGVNAWSNPFATTAWNGMFSTPFSTIAPGANTGWTGATPWNWTANTPFNTAPIWNTIPSFFGANAFGYANNTPAFNPAFFSNMSPAAFAAQNTPVNNPYFNASNTTANNGSPFQSGMPTQNTNPGLCRDAA